MIGRREFITLLGSAAAWPLAARAQERMRRVGVLMNTTSDEPDSQARITALAQGLQEAGWAVGRNLRIDTRWSGGNRARLRKDAADLVALGPDVIVAGVGPTTLVLQQASRTVPIVMAQAIDPVGFTDYLRDGERPVADAPAPVIQEALGEVSTRAGFDMPTPSTLMDVFDQFMLDDSARHDSALLETAATQCLLLAGFFESQMRHRHNIRWYAGLGAGFFREALMAADQASNIVFDTSSSNSWIKFHPGLTLRDVFARAIDGLGPERVLFGTDSSFFPRGGHAAIHDSQRAMATDLGLGDAVQAAIFGGNFQRLFPSQP